MPGPPSFLFEQGAKARGMAQNRIVLTVIILGIIIVAVAGLSVYLLGDYGAGYRFSVVGTVEYVGGWDPQYTLKYVDYTTPERDWKVLSTLWSFPWESGGIKAIATIGDNTQEYSLNTFNVINPLPGIQTFEIEFRHISAGYHICTIDVYEENCGLLPINCDKLFWDTDSIQINIEGE